MNYSQIRNRAQTGDLFLIKGRGLVSFLIRSVTGEMFSHVAVLCWLDDNKTCLVVVEMREFKGWQLSRASDWFTDQVSAGHKVYFGKAPEDVTDNNEPIKEYLFKRRQLKYDYIGLVKVLWSQIRKKGFRKSVQDRTAEVCSTFAASAWESTGVWTKPDKDFNPGNFAEYAKWTTTVKPDSKDEPVDEIT